MTMKTRKHDWLSGVLLAVGLVLSGAFLFHGLGGRISELEPQAAAAVSSTNDFSQLAKPIEEIRVGDRVVTQLPDEARAADEKTKRPHLNRHEFNPATWQLVRLRAEVAWDDGTIDDVNVESLQSPQWLELHQVKVGEQAPLPLDLVEMGMPADLTAKVLAIEPCPAIASGDGRIVLTTVNHLNRYVLNLTVEDESGREETIGVTGFHKFYSVTRDVWLSAEQLQPGEQLHGLSGALNVVSLRPNLGVHRVYNMTVEGEHVYRVSNAAVLVHNNDCIDILNPGGVRIGTPGSSPEIRRMPGGQPGAEELFEALTPNGVDITPPGHGGILTRIPEGTIGLRPVSTSGPPTIDVNIPSLPLPIKKVKFP